MKVSAVPLAPEAAVLVTGWGVGLVPVVPVAPLPPFPPFPPLP
ncbi:hypothetical protein [Mycobacterium marinum]